MEAVGAGAYDFLTKPVDAEELKLLLRRCVYVSDLEKQYREAQQAALEAVRPGATAGEVDRAARNLLKKKNLGQYFTHSTGHGVGLEIHEAPRIAAGQKEPLQARMVITIEPGAYLPGTCGVRIEDTVVVTETGCEILTACSKDLIAI